jgi:hypothetical protein
MTKIGPDRTLARLLKSKISARIDLRRRGEEGMQLDYDLAQARQHEGEIRVERVQRPPTEQLRLG